MAFDFDIEYVIGNSISTRRWTIKIAILQMSEEVKDIRGAFNKFPVFLYRHLKLL